MGGVPPRSRRPQYGWNQAVLVDSVSLGEPGNLTLPSETDPILRPNGVYRVALSGRVEGGDSSGTGTFGYILQGSNSGGTADSEWVELGRTNLAELYVASDPDLQAKAMALSPGRTPGGGLEGEGFIGEAQVPVDRWKYLRIKTFVEAESVPVEFEMSVRMTCTGADGESTINTSTLARVSGDTSEPATDAISKPAGVRYLSAQAYVDSLILSPGGSDGFLIRLQVAFDQEAVDAGQWLTLDVVDAVTAADQSRFFANGQSRAIDLGAFQFYRFKAEKYDDGSVSDNLSSYSIRCIATYDDADWIDGEQGIPLLHENIRKTFCMITFSEPTGVAPNLTFKAQVCDMNQIPIRAKRRIPLLLATDAEGFDAALGPTAQFVSVSGGASIAFGAGTNQAVITTNDLGEATILIDANADSPLYVMAWNSWLPSIPANSLFGPGQIIISTQKLELVP